MLASRRAGECRGVLCGQRQYAGWLASLVLLAHDRMGGPQEGGERGLGQGFASCRVVSCRACVCCCGVVGSGCWWWGWCWWGMPFGYGLRARVSFAILGSLAEGRLVCRDGVACFVSVVFVGTVGVPPELHCTCLAGCATICTCERRDCPAGNVPGGRQWCALRSCCG